MLILKIYKHSHISFISKHKIEEQSNSIKDGQQLHNSKKKNKLPVHAALGVGSRKKENLRILLTLEGCGLGSSKRKFPVVLVMLSGACL